MIICASRRTDIPAFHAEWLMNRLRAGYVLVRNPVAKNVVYRIGLTPRDVDCIVFITKNPAPMLPFMDEIMGMGLKCLFQVTVTPYGKDIEPNVPDKKNVVESVRRLAEQVGRDRVLWRYDPVLFGDDLGLAYHRERFTALCEELEGSVVRCAFSYLDLYPKLGPLVSSGRLRQATRGEKVGFASMAGPVAAAHGIRLTSCCTPEDLSGYGVERAGCLDANTLGGLGIPYEPELSTIRHDCLCVRSVDIGAYDTCRHDCIYCYANSVSTGRANRIYDDRAEMLCGTLAPHDRLVTLRGRSNARIDDYGMDL
jgi:hypothetical protein